MQQLKNYTGSVYGGLGHLLYAFYQSQALAIPEQLELNPLGIALPKALSDGLNWAVSRIRPAKFRTL
jgi:hypothetical protein